MNNENKFILFMCLCKHLTITRAAPRALESPSRLPLGCRPGAGRGHWDPGEPGTGGARCKVKPSASGEPAGRSKALGQEGPVLRCCGAPQVAATRGVAGPQQVGRAWGTFLGIEVGSWGAASAQGVSGSPEWQPRPAPSWGVRWVPSTSSAGAPA